MKALLVYATNSGSTLEVSNYISEEFSKKGKEITVKDARDVEPDEFNNYELILLGSPTWGDGNVHDLFLRLFEKSINKKYPGKKFGVFGLGDTTYAHFCTSVEHLSEYVKNIGGTLVGDGLKINNFYFNQEEEMPRIIEWADKIVSKSV